MGSQHPSPNVKNPLRIRAAFWLKIITSRDAKSACFKGSGTSCDVIIFGIFGPFFGIFRKKIASRDGCFCWWEHAHFTRKGLGGRLAWSVQSRLKVSIAEGYVLKFFSIFGPLPRGPCETPWCLAAKVDSPLSRDNFWRAITLAQLVS